MSLVRWASNRATAEATESAWHFGFSQTVVKGCFGGVRLGVTSRFLGLYWDNGKENENYYYIAEI